MAVCYAESALEVAALGVAAGVLPGVAAGEVPVTAGDAGFAEMPTGAGVIPLPTAPGLAGDMGEPASQLELTSHFSHPL